MPSPSCGGLTVVRPSRPLTLAGDVPSQGLALLSDLHFGAPNVDYALIETELRLAQIRDDRVLLLGDVFDMILSQDARRYRPSAIHRRLRGVDDVVNKAVDWAEEVLAPHADRIDVVLTGNHETAVEKHHSTDPIDLLVRRLQSHARDPKHRVQYGGYQAFVRYEVKGHRRPFTLFCWHGDGGGSGLGGAANELAQRAAWVEGCDVVWMAHRHVRLATQLERYGCPARGWKPARRAVWHVRTGSYFDTYGGQSQESYLKKGRRSNYAADKLLQPAGKGGARIVLHVPSPGGHYASRVELS